MPLPEIDSMTSAQPTGAYNSSKKPHRFFQVVFWPLAITCVLLVGYGLLVCWSATDTDPKYSFMRQLLGVVFGLVVMALIWAYDYRKLSDLYIVMLVVSVVLIISPHFPIIGVTRSGATSWINVGMQIQPGEFAKITIILFCAGVLSKYGGRLDDLGEYVKVVGLMLIPFVCIMTQPDLGTGLVYLFISATTLFMAGAKGRYMLVTLLILIIGIVLIFVVDEFLKYTTEDGSTEYRLLKQYQRARLFVFMNQDNASSDAESYNLRQAMIAIGSGALFGKGLGSSTQSSLGFLPEAPTDFIFCVLAEELGFVGVVLLLALYGCLIGFSILIARRCPNLFGMLIVCGIVGMWLFQILENIGMCIGLMPITGIPLPFVSYGSSFMIVNFAALGLIGSVYSHSGKVGKGI